jgi:hypothetical protein
MRFPCVVVGLLAVSHPALAQEHRAGHHDRVELPVSQAPKEAGQSAFAAIQEIVLILAADPSTDWDRVDLEALRQHLRDMDELTLRAEPVETTVANGLSVFVRGTGRTLEAIQRIVPAHVAELDQLDSWQAVAAVTPRGAEMTVTSDDPYEVQRIRGLGFIGLMVTGAHHQAHHLAIARGEGPHRQP